MTIIRNLSPEWLCANGFRPIYSGDTHPLKYTITRAGSPINMAATGARAVWTAKDSKNKLDAEAVIQKTIAGGGIILVSGGVDGVIQVNLEPADTAGLAGEYVYDLQIYTGDTLDQTITVTEGVVTIIQDVTQTP